MNKIKKALSVLRNDCKNPLIRNDMLDVLEREITGIQNTLDAACNHNEELISQLSEMREALEKINNKIKHRTNLSELKAIISNALIHWE